MKAIEVTNMSKNFKNFSLKNVDMVLPKGYIMGLIGANGAGKTTIIKILMGLYLRDGGEVKVLDMDPVKKGCELREHVGFVFDEPKFYDFKLKKIKKIIAPFYKEWDENEFWKLMKKFKLEGHLRFKNLSRGMKLKFALAIALSHNAKLLILDEPTSGLDPVFRLELLNLLQEIISNGDRSILFSSHITNDVEKIADYVTYIKDGEIVLSDTKDTILSSYILVKGKEAKIPDSISRIMVGGKSTPYFYEAILPKDNKLEPVWNQEEQPTLEQIMYYFETRGEINVEIDS